MPDLSAEEMVSNIEKYGDVSGPQEAPQEVRETLPAEEAPVNPYSFKDADAMMKHQLEYQADGKSVKEDLATILKRASQGYHYAQKMGQVNQTEKEWAEKIKANQELAENNKRWEQYNEYAKQNPEWHQHWSQAWENRGQQQQAGVDGQQQTPDLQALLDQKLAEKLAPIQEHFNSIQEQKARDAVLSEDKNFEAEVQSIRKQYPDIDFDATDPEDGKSLEYKVLEFGVANNIKSFKTAFKAFHHEKLVEREVLMAKDSWAKEGQKQRKNGIIDVRSTPSSAQPKNIKGLDWNQLESLAAKEFGIGD